ncbi:MAG: tRNA lysidine(34) synthetase TilS [Nonlabens sp.]|uniref:tRNA lysidine(34) synthetase TilS n=1 Tax=Nonlabens sp. TaxID=1888209 RepID=UPI003EF8D5F3
MLTAFQEHIATQFPDLKEKRILVAISGGLDSVVLSHLLHKLEYKIAFVHCNFKLRAAASDKDEQFVKNLAQSFDIQCFIEQFDTEQYALQKGISIQMAARELRYEFFDEICEKYSYNHVCTAHHLDDQLETFLINLNRGAGLNGLQGIPQDNGLIIRPLLVFTREQINSYALDNEVTWREDASNSSNKYQRNQLRNEILPLLHNALPQLRAHFAQSLDYLKGSQELVRDAVLRFRESGIKKTNSGIQINCAQLLQCGNPRAYLFEIIYEYGFQNMESAMDLLYGSTGKRIESENYIMLKNREWLVIEKQFDTLPVNIEINNIPGIYKFNTSILQIEHLIVDDPLSFVKNNSHRNVHYLDAAQIRLPLTLRNWNHGDRINPLGMSGSKLVSDVLTDGKVSFIDKEKMVVLTLNEEILWIVGIRASNHCKVTSSTKTIIKISYTL